jgi:hypothetical protein
MWFGARAKLDAGDDEQAEGEQQERDHAPHDQ